MHDRFMTFCAHMVLLIWMDSWFIIRPESHTYVCTHRWIIFLQFVVVIWAALGSFVEFFHSKHVIMHMMAISTTLYCLMVRCVCVLRNYVCAGCMCACVVIMVCMILVLV